jgi:hypothetical protein
MSHEVRDASGRSVFVFYGLLFSGVATALIASALMLRDVGIAAPLVRAPMMPEPALQVAPIADLAAHRAGEKALANVYGWVDRDKNIVRIPISQALQRVLERGLDDATAQVRR